MNVVVIKLRDTLYGVSEKSFSFAEPRLMSKSEARSQVLKFFTDVGSTIDE